MKILNKAISTLIMGSFITVGAHAAIDYGNGMSLKPYIGAKIGQYNPDVGGATDFGNTTSYGIYGGAKFTPNFGAEVEYMGTDDEEFINNVTNNAQYNAKTYGLYATYDFMFPNSPLYAKGRLGVAKNEVDIDTTNKVLAASSSASYSDTGIAGGLGLGYNIGSNAAVELLYNFYPSVNANRIYNDIDASGVTLGAHLKF